MALTDDHGSDEGGASAHLSSIYELPSCDSELEANEDICEVSLWPREVVPLPVVPEFLTARKSDDEPLRESHG